MFSTCCFKAIVKAFKDHSIFKKKNVQVMTKPCDTIKVSDHNKQEVTITAITRKTTFCVYANQVKMGYVKEKELTERLAKNLAIMILIDEPYHDFYFAYVPFLIGGKSSANGYNTDDDPIWQYRTMTRYGYYPKNKGKTTC